MNADLFRATLAKYKEMRHIKTQVQLMSYTTCGSYHTFKKWMDDPSTMPIGEIDRILDALKVPREDKVEIFY